MADGPLQNLASVQVTLDSNGALVLWSKAASGSDSPARNAFNTRVRCETGNALVVAFK